MRFLRLLFPSATLLGCQLHTGTPAAAEWFAALYTNPGITESDEAKVDGRARPQGVGSAPVNVELKDVGPGDLPAFGLRVGRWGERTPAIGVAIDAFFSPNGEISASQYYDQSSTLIRITL